MNQQNTNVTSGIKDALFVYYSDKILQGDVRVAIKHQSGSRRRYINGVELLQNNEIRYSLYERKHDNADATGAVYDFSNVEEGTYTIRVWSSQNTDNEWANNTTKVTVTSNSTQVLSGDVAVGTWTTGDNSTLSDGLKAVCTSVGTGLKDGQFKYKEETVTFPIACTGTIEYTYTGLSSTGNPQQLDILGFEVLNEAGNTVLTSDVHFGSIGASNSKNTYNFTIPAAGTYKVRTWVDGKRTLNSSGNVTYTFDVSEWRNSIVASKYVGEIGDVPSTNVDNIAKVNEWLAIDHKNTISTDKYYVIENAKNTRVAIFQEQEGNYTFKYAPFVESDARFVFRFADKGTETSSNWGSTSRTYDTFKIYCVGSTKKGFINWGTWNSNVSCGNRSDGYPFKVAEVETAVYQFSAKSTNDNFTISTHGGDNTTLADNANGHLHSWNIYTNVNTNVWKIREVEAPTAPTQSVSISSVKVATFYTAKTLSIPEGVTAKKVVDAQNPQQGDVYHLVYKELQNEIPAGTPVVLFGEPDAYQFPRSLVPHDYVEIRADGSADNRLIGTVRENATATGSGEDGTLYALGNKNGLVAFYHFLGSQVTAGKAYLDARGINGGSTSNVRAFAIFDEETGTVTNINTLIGETTGEGTTFDLAGRCVNANVKGISIVNGKKVIR